MIVLAGGTDRMRQSWRVVEGDEVDAPPVFAAVARQRGNYFFPAQGGGGARKGGAGLR